MENYMLTVPFCTHFVPFADVASFNIKKLFYQIKKKRLFSSLTQRALSFFSNHPSPPFASSQPESSPLSTFSSSTILPHNRFEEEKNVNLRREG